MEVKVKPKIHNRFDIFKKNIATGEEKQVAYAENIILNTMWTRLCNFQAYFAYIAYGTGSGELSVARTALFTHEGLKAVTSVEKLYGMPTSSWRQKIELGLTDSVGKTLTEVGINYDSSAGHLVTHALLRDMNGNPISILKTNVDILTIYATVYFTLDNTHASIKFLYPGDNNLIAYLMGGSAVSNGCFVDEYGGAPEWPGLSPGVNYYGCGMFGTGSWTADVANKRTTLATPRLAVSDGNCNIKGIDFCHVARLALPASGIYAGLDLVGVPVASGDGIKTEFVLPSDNIDVSTLSMKLNGIANGNITTSAINNDKAVSMLKTYDVDTDKPLDIGFNHDGTIMCQKNTVKGYKFYDFADGAWIERNQTPVGGWPTTNLGRIMFSANDNVLMIGANVYDFTGGQWIKRPNVTLPYEISLVEKGTCISANGLVFATMMNSNPKIYVADWNGISWVGRSLPDVSSSYGATQVYLNTDGSTLCCQLYNYLRSLTWNGSSWTKRTDLNVMTDYPICIDSTGMYAIAGPATGTYGLSYLHYENNAWAMIDNSAYGSMGSKAGYASDNLDTIAIGIQSTPYLAFFRIVNNKLVKLSQIIIGSGDCRYNAHQCGISGNGSVACIRGNSNTNEMYCFPLSGTKVTFTTPPGLITGEAVGTGDAATTLFNLDHDPIADTITIYLDGVATTDYTRSGAAITFNSAPGTGVAITSDYKWACPITADYTVRGIHKTTARVIDVTFTIQFGEPV